MRSWILWISIVCVWTPLHAEVYKWTDSSGNVHYTDMPHKGAEKLDLPEGQSYSSPPVSPTEATKPADIDKETDTTKYNISIIQPQNQATIRNNQGYVPVVVDVQPELKAGYQLQLIYDGTSLGKPQESPMFALNNVLRGSHTISVQLLSPDGEVVENSEPVTVFMHRPRVGMVPQTRPNP